ncbi:MAG: Uma2 family endonuclease [Polyangiaceae bacterium]|jgi:Uma2 family endonuclease|nr:Uma2 family endonuclease [Polyangiaceae bacterium]
MASSVLARAYGGRVGSKGERALDDSRAIVEAARDEADFLGLYEIQDLRGVCGDGDLGRPWAELAMSGVAEHVDHLGEEEGAEPMLGLLDGEDVDGWLELREAEESEGDDRAVGDLVRLVPDPFLLAILEHLSVAFPHAAEGPQAALIVRDLDGTLQAMGSPAERQKALATFDDIRQLENGVRVEIIGGEIVPKEAATFEHSRSQFRVGSKLSDPFDRGEGRGGPGGWWFGTEAEVEYDQHEVYVHDLAGWRRGRCPEPPSGRPVRVRPDWVCEILSPSNWTNDMVKKFATMKRSGVAHYWIVDLEHRVLTVYRWNDGDYIVAAHAQPGEVAALEPFDAISLEVGVLFGDEAVE